MKQPEVLLGCVSNLWSKQMHFVNVGDTEEGHTHLHDHLTLLAAGGLNVTVDGKTTEFKAPHMIYIRAGQVHELVATEPNTVAYCIHALRDGDRVEDIIDPSLIPAGAQNVFDYAKPILAVNES